MSGDNTSLLRSGAPSENPFLAFQPIPIPPPDHAPGRPSDDEDEVEPPEMSSRRSRNTPTSNRQRTPNRITTRQVGSPRTGTSSSSSSMSPTGPAGAAASADPFALSNFEWTRAAAAAKPASSSAAPSNPNSSSASRRPQPAKRASIASSVDEEDFLGFGSAAGGSSSAAAAPPMMNRPTSNPFEEFTDPFQHFDPTANIFEPTPLRESPAAEAAPIVSPPQPQRRAKRRHTAPVGSIDSAVEKLRATSGKANGSSSSLERKSREGEESDDSDETPVPPSKSKTPSKNQMKRRNSAPVSQLHDCISELHRGTALLKYGRRGYPHFRQFQLSLDNSQLQWFSKKKATVDSAIALRDIDEVRTGQSTPEFERVGWTSLAPASFSILYANRTRRLSLVAKSVDEQKMWVEAIRTLRDKAKRGHNMAEVDEVLVHVDYRDRNRPQSRRHSGKFVRGHETSEKNVDNLLHKKLITDVASLKERFRTIAASSNHPTIMASAENDSIRQILSELEERLEELDHEVRHTRDTKIAENDVWRTKVDLEALEEKIQVLIRPKRRWSIKRV